MKGIVRCAIENLGTEIWLVSNPDETQAAFDAEATDCPACDGSGETPYGQCNACDGTGEDGISGLDRAAAVSTDTIVLASHWGTDIPRERDTDWLKVLMGMTRPHDRDTLSDLITQAWNSSDNETLEYDEQR